MDKKSDVLIFKTDDNTIELVVHTNEETVWLTLSQMAALFERDKSVISKHLKNIFKEQECKENAVVANFATTAADGKSYQVNYYELDAILAVGYRVNSKRGSQFRKWASSVLKEYLIKGYALNQTCLYKKGLNDITRSLALLSTTLTNQSLINDIGEHALNIIQSYASTWALLLAYDEKTLDIEKNIDEDFFPYGHSLILDQIHQFKQSLIQKKEASPLFGQQREEYLFAIFQNIHQTFDSTPLYSSYIERAAHLLYFVIKDHPFVDGNKRIASFLFVLYLKAYKKERLTVNTKTLVALALLIAESLPADKELMIKLIVNLIEKEK